MYPSSCSYYQLAVVTAETMAAEGLKEVQEEEEHRALAERSKSTMPAYEDHSGVSARKATSKQSPSADHKDKGGGLLLSMGGGENCNKGGHTLQNQFQKGKSLAVNLKKG